MPDMPAGELRGRTMRDHTVTLPSTCGTRQHATPGFANLGVTKRGGVIEFDPHVDGSCVITLGEQQARKLMEALARWLG